VIDSIYSFTSSLHFFSETGQTDDMKRLEEKAKQLAEESLRDQPKQDKNILFVR
jgi:hypothetical protein